MKKYDLIVVGGGIAGVAAAVSAARDGLEVLLVEKFGCLGGALSNSLVFPFMKHVVPATGKVLSDGIFTEMKKRKDEYEDPSWECYKFVFDDMVTEAGVDVLFHSTVFEAKTEGRNVKSVSVATKSGVFYIEADFFIDASGDGELIDMTGCEFQLGRESDSLSQPMTTCFRVANVDIDKFVEERDALQLIYNEHRKAGKILNPRENILVFRGIGKDVLHLNTTRIVKHNPVDPFEISRAEISARKQIHEIMCFLRENSKAFTADSCIVSIASHIGVRESRKLKGVHVLTADELVNCTDFEDTIALGNYGIDIHNPDGTGTDMRHMKDDEYYRIPYRSLLPKEYDNMLVAGRCLSATHEAHSAVRVMPICACLGEAAGIAVSAALKSGTNMHTVNIKEVQKKLLDNGAAI